MITIIAIKYFVNIVSFINKCLNNRITALCFYFLLISKFKQLIYYNKHCENLK